MTFLRTAAMHMIKRGHQTFLVAPLLLCGWYASALGQVPQKTLSPDELRDDLRILRWTFERAHAGLYRYTSRTQMDAAFDRVDAQISKPMTELEFFRLLATLIDRIHDAHTALRPGADTLKYIGQTARVFPIDVRYIKGRAFVEKNFGPNQAIPIASEILSINGVPIKQITEKILTVKSADGLNRVPKYEVANVNFWINYFEMVSDAEVFSIKVRNPRSGKLEAYSTSGVSARVMQTGQFQVQTHDPFALDFLEDGRVALMSIASFGELELIDQLADAFQKIKERGTKTLIIDIRDNAGGWDELNTELLSYLVPHPFQFYRGFKFRAKSWEDLKYAEYSPDDFLNNPDLKQFSEAERKKMVLGRTLSEVLEHNISTNPAAGLHRPKPNVFPGKVYLLINGRSGSSGGEVPALMHSLRVGILVGEEPNAAYQGTCGGVILKLPLPHSSISVNVPLLAYENAVRPGLFVARGVRPHFVVGQTLRDAIEGRDTVMQFTLNLIRKTMQRQDTRR